MPNISCSKKNITAVNTVIHTCPLCDYQWKTGEHGGHSCTTRLYEKVQVLEKENKKLLTFYYKMKELADKY